VHVCSTSRKIIGKKERGGWREGGRGEGGEREAERERRVK